MPVVVDPDPTSLAALLKPLPPCSHGVVSVDRMLAWLDQHPDEYVVVLGPGLELDVAVDACDRLRTTRPTTSVVLVRAEVDTPTLTRAIKAGARDVVPHDDPHAVESAVARAHELSLALRGPTGTSRRGRIVTVFSPKGGVGKTTVAVNLALALADGGARHVCLVDLDLAFGDVAITLQLFPTHTVEHAIGSEDSLDLPQLEGLLTRHTDALSVLAAPAHPDVRERVTPVLVARLLRTLTEGFDHVVVDTAPAFDEATLAALDETDDCVVVATLDVPTLKNVKVALETLEMLAVARGHRHLLLNRADDAVGLGPDKVEAILGMGIAAEVTTAIEIAAATNAGRPIVAGSPDHQASVAIRGLAARITGDQVPVDDGSPAPVARSTRRFRIRR
ncbi:MULTISPECIES: AAA family ATPase [unclassified Nocardioides]|uniref:AAA family ATPase n=1 Tax=unclassified Nocardioides TaxID=2615069 RepID=UPI003014B887